MSRARLRIAAGCAIGLALAACSQISAVATRLVPDAASPPAAALPEGGAQLRLRLPGQETEIRFAQVAESRGVVTFASASGQSLAFRQGVLVATRGFGFDLMAAEIDGTLAALSGGGPAEYRRRMVYLDGENRQLFLSFGCRMEIEDGKFSESCTGSRASFTNLYVPAPGGGILRSAQWVSPELGAFALLPGR